MRRALCFLRTAIGVPLLAVTMALFAIVIGACGETQFSERMLRAWCRLVLFIAGVRLVSRAAPFDLARSYVFVANHTSHVDVPAIVVSAPGPIRFIAKQELSRIPFFGWAARRMGHVFIDRKDPHGAAEAIGSRFERGLSGVGLLFFVEGTRATTDELLPFKKGAAVAAIETGLDCVAIGIAGAREVLSKGSRLFRPGPVAVVFGAPIPVAGHALEDRDRLVREQRAAVEVCVAEARALVAESSRKSRVESRK